MSSWSRSAVWSARRGAVVACLLVAGCMPPPGADVPEARGTARGAGPALHPRCRGHDMARVPATYAAFEAEILAWMATCVTSRTGGARREVPLVAGNPTLEAVWRGLTPGRRVRIVPRYEWSPGATAAAGRVERIAFWSPDVPGTRPPDLDGAPPGDDTGGGASPPRPGARDVPGPGSRPGRRVWRDPPPARPDPPDDLEGVLDDARRLLGWLRSQGADDDARRLAALIERAAPLVRDVAILVGAYYFATKLRGGRLLFLWGWNAGGRVFARRLARLDRLLPGVEGALGRLSAEIARVAGRHPRLAGSGIDWKVIGQVVDPRVPAQLDAVACGPACVKMALDGRGIHVSHEELVARARARIHPEIKSKMVSPGMLRAVLQELDPKGGWIQDTLDDSYFEGKTFGQVFGELGRRGPWIAQVDRHFVVVDGLDSGSHVLIRDPWYEPARQRGIQAGSRYRLTIETFWTNWLGVAIYRP